MGKTTIEALSRDGLLLSKAPPKVRADRAAVLAAVSNHGLALQWASDELRSDKEVVLVAVAHPWPILQFASMKLRADREVILAAVAAHGPSLQWATESLRGDKEIVMSTVQHHGLALQWASSELRSDRDVILAAVTSNGFSLDYASADVGLDEDFWQSLQHELQYFYVLKVTMLSGRSCFSVWDVDDGNFTSKTKVLATCANALGLDSAQIANSYLLIGSEVVPDTYLSGWGLEAGRVYEIQLLVQSLAADQES